MHTVTLTSKEYESIVNLVEELMRAEVEVSIIYEKLYKKCPTKLIEDIIKDVYVYSPEDFEMSDCQGNIYYRKRKKDD